MNKDQFQCKTTPYLRQLMQRSDAVRQMYEIAPEHERIPVSKDIDLLNEKALTQVKGLVWKYQGRALLLLSYTCAANCRYCERQDRVGVGLDREGLLSEDAIRKAASFVSREPSISEVIFSGGDPLTNRKGLLLASQLLAELPQIKILRIHTRVPVQMPSKVDLELMRTLSALRPTYYFSLHIDHPDEITDEVVHIIVTLRRFGFILLCQTVFLKGINDSVQTLGLLFSRLAELGVRPYYIYHCQAISTTTRFVMSITDEVEIMTTLRERLSGLAFPQHVIDMPGTTGKVIVPTRHWRYDLSSVRDFVGSTHDFSNPIADTHLTPSP